MAFLESQSAQENLLFWQEVQRLKAAESNSEPALVDSIWQELYLKFIAPGSPSEINIDSRLVSELSL